ncbi:MAG: DUF1015 family protein [Thermoplasmata archaeon]
MDIIPFKPLIYRKDMDGMLAPPFDAITPQQEIMLKKNCYNITYLTLPRGSNRIEHANRLLQAWKDSNVLSRSEEPLVIILEQRFHVDGRPVNRYGIISKVRVYPEDDTVIPHEDVFGEYVEERRNLMFGTGTQLEPIFLISTKASLTKYLSSVASSLKCDIKFTGPENIENLVYYVREAEIINEVRSLLRTEKAIVADGHHRLKAVRQIAESRKDDTLSFWQYALAYTTSVYDDGVIIGGVHRIVSSGFKLNISDLEEFFSVEEIQTFDRSSITIYNGKFYRIIPKNREEFSNPVEIVNSFIFSKLLGFTLKDMERHIIYTHDLSQIIDSVDNKGSAFAVLMPDWNKEDLISMLKNHVKLPQKSTYFYPKIPSGIAIDSLR